MDNSNESPKQRQLPAKEFKLRNSLLHDFFANNKHLQTVEHLIGAGILFWFLSNGVNSYYDNGQTLWALLPNSDFLAVAFQNTAIGVLVWLQMMAFTLAFYLIVRLWHHFRPATADFCKSDLLLLVTVVIYQTVFLWSTYDVLFRNPILGPAVATAITLEQVRLIAKMYSFAREKLRQAPSTQTFPTFGWYLYFLFAPTLVYRDSYPMSPERRWNYIFVQLALFLGCCTGYYLVMDRFWLAEYASYMSQPVTKAMIVKTIFAAFVPGIAMNFFNFYGFFDKWLNLWAELLRFGDREFYQDFWTATTPFEHARKWNAPVQNFLYTYIYKEYFDFVKARGRFIPTMLVFFVSWAFHEFVVIAMLRFYFPFFLFYILLFALTLGLGKYQPPSGCRSDNFKNWINNCIAYSAMFLFYFFELTARHACTGTETAPAHFWTCFPAASQ